MEVVTVADGLRECDLVMKGGITSGVVYPGVVLELADEYRFRSIGGTSAGAIAAAICAAAEYGRQRGEGRGMEQLEAAVNDLTKPGFLLGLFQPTEPARPLFDTALAAMAGGKSRWSRVRTVAKTALAKRPAAGLAALLFIAGLGVITAASFSGLPLWLAIVLAALIALPIALLLTACAALAALGLLGARTLRSLGDSDYGICPGSHQRGGDALVEWLHSQIQRCVGRELDECPLTLGELKQQGIELRMMTTDLSFARPVVIPDGLKDYLFDPQEMLERFPEPVVKAMVGNGDMEHTSYMPTDGLPVVVAARLSLSFPGLLSAMPLYSPDPRTKPQVMRHLFSDGGIASNFPLQFFDAWFPRWPTFGIDLADYPGAGEALVFMPPNPKEPLPPRWREVKSITGFVGQIKDTMENWRDSMQMELPSYRDRVCQIRLTAGEGGLNLNMDREVIKSLIERGHDAGKEILHKFDDAEWSRHRFVRYLVLMQMLQENLAASGPPLLEFTRTLPAVGADADYPRSDAWRALAATATGEVITLGDGWGPPPATIDFGGDGTPVPVGVMRIVPNA
jgi:predicted acylesterase/phospholipase RssA